MSRLVDLIAEQNAVAFKEAIQEKIASKVIFALEQEKIAVAKAMLESKDEEDDEEDEGEMDDEEDDEEKESK
jgi:Holliday junction resolvasome RuvABC DNA-binding subunit